MSWLTGKCLYMRTAEEKNTWTSSIVVSISKVTDAPTHNMLHALTPRSIGLTALVLRSLNNKRWLP